MGDSVSKILTAVIMSVLFCVGVTLVMKEAELLQELSKKTGTGEEIMVREEPESFDTDEAIPSDYLCSSAQLFYLLIDESRETDICIGNKLFPAGKQVNREEAFGAAMSFAEYQRSCITDENGRIREVIYIGR